MDANLIKQFDATSNDFWRKDVFNNYFEMNDNFGPWKEDNFKFYEGPDYSKVWSKI